MSKNWYRNFERIEIINYDDLTKIFLFQDALRIGIRFGAGLGLVQSFRGSFIKGASLVLCITVLYSFPDTCALLPKHARK